ncbi:MAG: GNVR domain-containing protein [Candidatus Zhuqueibacterota bacterium]
MDFLNFIRILRKRILILAILPLVAVPLTIYATRNQPKTYSSYVMISMGLTGGSVTLDASTKAFERMKQTMNMLELARSRSVYEELGFRLLRHDLVSDRPFRISTLDNPNFSFHDINTAVILIDKMLSDTSIVSLSREENYLVKKLAKDRGYDFLSLARSFKIYQIGDSDFLRIMLDDQNPEYIVFALNTLTAVFIEKYRMLVAGESGRSREFFENQVNKAAQHLHNKEQELKTFKEQNNIVMLSEQIKGVVSQLSKYENLLDENEQTIETLKASIWKIESKLSDVSTPSASSELMVTNAEIVSLTEQLKTLEKEFLIRRYEQGAEDVVDLETQIEQLREKIRKLVHEKWLGQHVDPQVSRQEMSSRLLNDQIELEMTKARRDVIQREVDRLRTFSNNFAPMEATYAQLNRDIQVAEQEYLEMLEKLNLARAYESNSMSSTNLKIVERAFPPQYPMASKRKMLVIMAGMGSFIFGVVSIFILEYFDVSVRSIKQAERLTESTVIAGIPKIHIDPENDFNLLSRPQNNEQKLFKESLRSLRNHIAGHEGNNKVIVITSSKPAEGKSLVTATLGILFALAHHRTLLVDGNLKHPSLEALLEVTATHWVQDVLQGRATLAGSATATGIDNLSALCARESYLSLLEIASPVRLREFIAEMKAMFDVVLFDTPGMNEFADAFEIMNEADLSLFIIRSGNTFQEADDRHLQILKNGRARYVGVVLNEMGWDFLDPIFGEIEKPRSFVHVLMKRLVMRQFSVVMKNLKKRVLRKNDD